MSGYQIGTPFYAHAEYGGFASGSNSVDGGSNNNHNNGIGIQPGPNAAMNAPNGTGGMASAAPSIVGVNSIQDAMQAASMQQQQQQQQPLPQQQPQSLLYDMSSFDPLQAQALQLSASAGLTPADLLAAAAAPTLASGLNGGVGGPVGGPVGSAVPVSAPQPVVSVPSYTQPPTAGASVSIARATETSQGQLQPIQPVPTPAPLPHAPAPQQQAHTQAHTQEQGTAQALAQSIPHTQNHTHTTHANPHAQATAAPATAAPNPYIFIQPQQIAPGAALSTTAFPTAPSPAASNALLLPAASTTAAGVPAAASLAASNQATAQAQAAAVAAAAAGFGTHPLLFNPVFFSAAAAQGVQGLAATTAQGHVLQQQQHHSQVPVAAAPKPQAQQAAALPANPLSPPLILPAGINPLPAAPGQHSKKRPLGMSMPVNMGMNMGIGMNVGMNMNMNGMATTSGGLMNEISSSVVSSSTVPPTSAKEGSNKRQRQTKKTTGQEGIPGPEDPAEKRRYERNLREQQRSSKISSQIKELREVLADCNVPFKPNKYSILLKVVEYIKQLQSRAIMLDAEHQKLITTVRQTNEMIASAANNNSNNNAMSSTTGGVTDNESSDATCHDAWQHGRESNHGRMRGGDSELCFVKGIDYRSIFEQCPTAFGIAALDGRILECNVEFQNLLGYNTREDLLKQSLFNLVHNHQDIFRAMAQMLKTAEEPTVPQTQQQQQQQQSQQSPTQAQHNNNNSNGANPSTVGAPTPAGTAPVNDGSTARVADQNNNSSSKSMDIFWTGPVTSKQNVKLSMNITLTAGDNGTPKFFSCALTHSAY